MKDKGKHSWAVGKNHVCIKHMQFLSLEKRRVSVIMQRVVLIQSWWRMLTERDRFLVSRNAAICLQTGTVYMCVYYLVRRHQAQRQYTFYLFSVSRMRKSLTTFYHWWFVVYCRCRSLLLFFSFF